MTTTRKVIRATYSHDEEFKIPVGVDLNDKSQVANWGIKWNSLWITYADDGREEEIEGEGWVNDFDFKRPESVEILTIEVDKEDICEVCRKVDWEDVGFATGFNGVVMRVCSICDTDGSNYNGWGGDEEDVAVAVEEKCEECGITAKDEDTGLGLSTLATTNQLLCPTCIPAEFGEGEDEEEDDDDDRPVCDVCDERVTPDAMHSIDYREEAIVDNICDDCLGTALDERRIERYSDTDDDEDDEPHYMYVKLLRKW
jgi:hypothetical protein